MIEKYTRTPVTLPVNGWLDPECYEGHDPLFYDRDIQSGRLVWITMLASTYPQYDEPGVIRFTLFANDFNALDEAWPKGEDEEQPEGVMLECSFESFVQELVDGINELARAVRYGSEDASKPMEVLAAEGAEYSEELSEQIDKATTWASAFDDAAQRLRDAIAAHLPLLRERGDS